MFLNIAEIWNCELTLAFRDLANRLICIHWLHEPIKLGKKIIINENISLFWIISAGIFIFICFFFFNFLRIPLVGLDHLLKQLPQIIKIIKIMKNTKNTVQYWTTYFSFGKWLWENYDNAFSALRSRAEELLLDLGWKVWKL